MARRLLLLLFVLAISLAASATRIQTSDPNCGPNAIPIHDGDQITFTPDQNGGGSTAFCNLTSENWNNLLMAIITNVDPEVIDCTTTNFKACQLYTTDTQNLVYAYFYGTCISTPGKHCQPHDVPGVPIGDQLVINLDCPNDNCSGPPFQWTPGTKGYVYPDIPPDANGDPSVFPTPPMPEPTSMAMVGIGFSAAYLRKRRFKSIDHR